ncbi:hypothetical protein [Paenibacillus cremeus]|uniref:HK97 gp10 family phage protein n=1 Tax=Paenibacillus cremeus TaxID=2163881 RepID=A0A559KCW2_9BACL|nr:hypothetical protein [Paenibacillus cremeus]TVY09972.1 hypothetical protein FPZ49_11415 [Paenibacillus cremeus]
MPTFNSLNELQKYIESQASKVLKNEVAQTVTQEMSETIKEVEYPKYVSHAENPYIRQMDDGGLSDVRNMQVEVIDDNTISITNERMDGTTDVAQIFATGIGYTWKNSEIYSMQPFPRNFYADTVERLLKNQKHVEAFKQGMTRLGLNVK